MVNLSEDMHLCAIDAKRVTNYAQRDSSCNEGFKLRGLRLSGLLDEGEMRESLIFFLIVGFL